jgi:hypothetical protein
MALLSIVSRAQPPGRFIVVADVISLAAQKSAALQALANAWQSLPTVRTLHGTRVILGEMICSTLHSDAPA